MTAGIALAVSIFVVSAGALAPRDEGENAARVQYDSEDPAHANPSQATALTQSKNVPPTHSDAQTADTGYYVFYSRWLARAGASFGGTPS
jgi:hypothetical protein